MCCFPIFSTLELKNEKVGPPIWIIHEISSLEPAPKVLNPKSRSKHHIKDYKDIKEECKGKLRTSTGNRKGNVKEMRRQFVGHVREHKGNTNGRVKDV